MLKQILDNPKLAQDVCSIVLLPPCTDTVYTYNDLADHVIPIQPNTKELIAISGTVFKFGHGCIITCSSEPIQIKYSKLLYNKQNRCTHVVLYMNRDVVMDHMDNKNIQKNLLRHPVFPKVDILISEFCNVSYNSLPALLNGAKKTLEESLNLAGSRVDSELIENYVMEETYDMVFFKISQLIIDQDKELWKSLTDLDYLDFSQIGLPTYVQNGRKRVQNATVWFEKIGSFRTPLAKLECLLRTLKELSDPDLYASTDTLVPLFLMTLIRSKVPHLMANLVYIKDYNFGRSVTCGSYGYSVSTFEGVLDYILFSVKPELSKKNKQLWNSIQTGDVALFAQYYSRQTFDPRDREGKNALLNACLYGQCAIIDWILRYQGGVQKTDRDDMKRTPLMCAIQSGAHASVSLLLQDNYVVSTLRDLDSYGDSAIMYICRTGDVFILEQVLKHTNLAAVPRNPISMDTPLHRASQCPSDFVLCLLELGLCPFQKNKKRQTFYHLTRDRELLRLLSRHGKIDWNRLLQDMDQTGQSALMVWANQGRLDLMELVSADTLHDTDHHGRTVLHLLAKQSKLIMGDKSLDSIIKKYRYLIHAKDWPDGNTALHLAVRYGQRAMIPLLYRYGASFDDTNWKGVQPTTYLSEGNFADFLDKFLLKTKKHRQGIYTWCLTRANITCPLDIKWIIMSEKGTRPETIKSVERRLQDFLFLRNQLSFEVPELVLPSLEDLAEYSSPLFTHFILQRLQFFMIWLEKHPVLYHHDLVLSFVRSSCWEPSVIRDHSISRKQLLEEKLGHLSYNMNSTEEERFFSYIQDTIHPLQKNCLELLTSGRQLDSIRQDLQMEQFEITTNLKAIVEPGLFEIIKVCANAVCSYSPLTIFLKEYEASNDLMKSVVSLVQRPLDMIQKRRAMRQDIEDQKDLLKKTKNNWLVFSKEHRTIEQEKSKVVHDMEELDMIDSQIVQSHRKIADELAHFQILNTKRLMSAIRNLAQSTLEIEKHKLNLLTQTSNKWDHF